MHTEEVAAVRRLLDAFNRGDFSALDELDPQAELQDEPRIPDAGWNYGHAGAVKWAVKLWQSFGRLSFEIDEPIETSDCLVPTGGPAASASAAASESTWRATASSACATGRCAGSSSTTTSARRSQRPVSLPAVPLEIVLARHGETEWSRDGRHTGRTDVPLTEEGRRQGLLLRDALAEWTFVRVLSSPLE